MRLRWIFGMAAASALLAGAALAAVVDQPVAASGPTTFVDGCNGAQSGTLYRATEVEPYNDVNPLSTGDATARLIGVYQQDRYSNGGARGQGTSVSTDGGRTWDILTPPQLPKFSQCQGNPLYERATDPWVSYSPNGSAHQVTLSFNDRANFHNAVLVSKSTNDGQTWSAPKTVIRDENPAVFNDKESITADHTDSSYVYVVWDRLVFPNERTRGQSFFFTSAFRGPTYFSRSTDNGETYEKARPIFDPGQNDQTIGNQIVALGNADLVNVMTVFRNDNRTKSRGSIAVLRSTNHGSSWSGEIRVSQLGTVGVRDPDDGHAVRTGDIIPEISSDESDGNDDVYVVWQDARFNGFQRDQVAFSRSEDGGRTWSTPVRISTDNTTQAFTPQIKVDDEGNIGVTYYDFRNDVAGDAALSTDTWFTRSEDGGRTWKEEQVTKTSFDMRTAPDARGYFVGDYEGLTALGTTFYPFSSESRGSTDVFSYRANAPFGGTAYSPSSRENNRPAAASFPVIKGKPTPR